MPRYEAIVHVTDPEAFIEQAYAARNSSFARATCICEESIGGPRTVSAPGSYVSIASEDRLNVEDIMLVELGMDQDEADSFIKEVRIPGER